MAIGEVIKRLSASLSLDTGEFKRGSQDAQNEMERLSKRMAAIGATLGVAVVAAFGAVAKAGIEGAIAQKQAVAQVEAALASMGNAAGRTAAQLVATADAQEMSSLFDADVILKQVTANLLTFGNVAGEQFDRAQQAALDMATRLGGEPQAAAIMLGKALNDPIAGITALSRVGVSLSDDQKELIRTMAETGNVAGAQGIILAEVEREFRGAAAAAADATPYRAFQVIMGQIADTVGEALLPSIISMRDWLVLNQGAIIETVRAVVDMGGTIVRLVQQLTPLIAGFAAFRLAMLAANAAQVIYTAGMIAATRVIGAAQAGTLSLNAALVANPFGAVAIAVGLLTTALFTLVSSQRQARAETDNLITSLKALAAARSEDFKGQRALLAGRIAVAEGTPANSGFADRLLPQWARDANVTARVAEISSLRTTLKEVDKAYADAAQSADNIVVPMAQSGAAAAGAGRQVRALVDSVRPAADAFQSLYDRLFPYQAASRKFAEEMSAIQKSRLSDAQKEEAIARLEREAFNSRTGGLGAATVSRRLLDTGPLIDFGKEFDETMKAVEAKSRTQTVQIAESFKDMADNSIQAFERLTNAIKGGGFLDILGSAVGLFLQIGGSGLLGNKLAANINAPRIPGNAQGTNNWRGGLSWVGERGPELVNMPRGSQVISNRDLRAANDGSRGAHVTVGIDPRNGNLTAFVDGRAAQMVPIAAQAGSNMAQAIAGRSARRRVR